MLIQWEQIKQFSITNESISTISFDPVEELIWTGTSLVNHLITHTLILKYSHLLHMHLPLLHLLLTTPSPNTPTLTTTLYIVYFTTLKGRIQSIHYHGSELQRFTAFRLFSTSVLKILIDHTGIFALSSSSLRHATRGGVIKYTSEIPYFT